MFPARLANLAKGKGGYPSIAHSITCDDEGRALAVLKGACRATSDMIILRYVGGRGADGARGRRPEDDQGCAPGTTGRARRGAEATGHGKGARRGAARSCGLWVWGMRPRDTGRELRGYEG